MSNWWVGVTSELSNKRPITVENFAPTASPASTDCEQNCCNGKTNQISDFKECYSASLSQINGSENIKGELGPPCCTGGDSKWPAQSIRTLGNPGFYPALTSNTDLCNAFSQYPVANYNYSNFWNPTLPKIEDADRPLCNNIFAITDEQSRQLMDAYQLTYWKSENSIGGSWVRKPLKKAKGAVIIVHGGSWQGNTSSTFFGQSDLQLSLLNNKGESDFYFISPDYGNSPEFRYNSQVDTVLDAIQKLRSLEGDDIPITLYGASAGGSISAGAAAVLAAQNKPVANYWGESPCLCGNWKDWGTKFNSWITNYNTTLLSNRSIAFGWGQRSVYLPMDQIDYDDPQMPLLADGNVDYKYSATDTPPEIASKLATNRVTLIVGANEILVDEVLYFGKITNGNVIVDDKNGGDHGNAGIYRQPNYRDAFVEMVKNTSIKTNR
jgi:acetyl esterase/lipase